MDELEKLLGLLLDNNLVTEESTAMLEGIKALIAGTGEVDAAALQAANEALTAENEALNLRVTDLETQMETQRQLYIDTFVGKVKVSSDGTTTKITEASGEGMVDYSAKTLSGSLDSMYE